MSQRLLDRLGLAQNHLKELSVKSSGNPSALESGIPKIPDVVQALESETFNKMQRYSEIYCRENLRHLAKYRWIKDALNQWSRIYEYPFCFENLKRELISGSKVLDAGSGVTFFPFFLSSFYKVVSVDLDDYSDVYSAINANQKTDVRFVQSDLHQLAVESESCDAVISISVLEHTTGIGEILKEFHRVLRPGGLLVVTFDVALDENLEGISPANAEKLIEDIRDIFQLDYMPGDFRDDLVDPEIYTTSYVRKWNCRLLPWPRLTLLSALMDFLKGHQSPVYYSNRIKMTFCNVTARKTTR